MIIIIIIIIEKGIIIKIIYEKEKHLSKINSPMILDFRAF